MTKTPDNELAAALKLYDALIAMNPKIERKGKTMPYTSLNGNMFSFLTKEGRLALRLSAADREAFIERHKPRPCEQHGVVMKEYVEVPPRLLKATAELRPYFDLSVAYAKSLKPKPTTRGARSKKKKVQ